MLNIVLINPLIPQNTGNIMRTCVALGAKLHLIEPLGFSLEDKYLKRAGLDYIDKLTYIVYPTISEFYQKNKGTFCYYSRYGLKSYEKAQVKKFLKSEVYLLFGKETTGIDKDILSKHIHEVYRIPTTDNVRSINLANCVALVAFDAYRQVNFKGLSKYEPTKYKGKNFIKNYGKETL